jgi:hypothetical protein
VWACHDADQGIWVVVSGYGGSWPFLGQRTIAQIAPNHRQGSRKAGATGNGDAELVVLSTGAGSRRFVASGIALARLRPSPCRFTSPKTHSSSSTHLSLVFCSLSHSLSATPPSRLLVQACTRHDQSATFLSLTRYHQGPRAYSTFRIPSQRPARAFRLQQHVFFRRHTPCEEQK